MNTAKTTEESKRVMDELYAKGHYKTDLPFDRVRGEHIRAATLDLATSGPHLRRTLDVGSGEGGIASFWPHQNIVGVEISEVAIERARAKHPEVTYVCSGIEDFVWEGPPFDIVVAQESIEHWVDYGKGLDSVRRCMAPGGRFVLTTPNRDSLHCRIGRKWGFEPPLCSIDHVHEFGYDELIDAVRKHGFTHDTSQGVGLVALWSLEHFVGEAFRQLTDKDEQVNEWLFECGHHIPAKYAFIQCHRFIAI